jgi:hypothetical protein
MLASLIDFYEFKYRVEDAIHRIGGEPICLFVVGYYSLNGTYRYRDPLPDHVFYLSDEGTFEFEEFMKRQHSIPYTILREGEEDAPYIMHANVMKYLPHFYMIQDDVFVEQEEVIVLNEQEEENIALV